MSKNSVYYKQILEAEEQISRGNHRLEREWQKLENRLAVTQVRLERAREIRDEYLDHLQKKYPQWRHNIRRSTDLYYEDSKPEWSRNEPINFVKPSSSILDRLSTRKYWSDIGSAELLHQVEARKQQESSSALKSDIDWIKKRLSEITNEIQQSKSSQKQITEQPSFNYSGYAPNEPRQEDFSFGKQAPSTQNASSSQQINPEKMVNYEPSQETLRQNEQIHNKSNATTKEKPEPTPEERENSNETLRRAEGPEIKIESKQNQDSAPRSTGPRFNFVGEKQENKEEPKPTRVQSEEKVESEIPQNPLTYLPAPYRPIRDTALSSSYNSFVKQGKPEMDSDSESDSMEDRINKAIGQTSAPVISKNQEDSNVTPQPIGKASIAVQQIQKPSKLPSYLKSVGHSSSESDVEIPSKKPAADSDDSDFFG